MTRALYGSGNVSRVVGLAGVVLAGVLLSAPRARADSDLFGFYVGASAGDARVKASPGSLVSSEPNTTTLLDPANFNATHSAFKVTAGVRPIAELGGEVGYVDFGHPTGHLGAASSDVTLKGADAFAVAYLPLYVVDIIVKAGLARLDNQLSGTGNFVTVGTTLAHSALFRLDRTNTNFAIGGGAQYSLGPLALRAEYERFEAAGGSPTLLTAGITWTF